MFFLRRAASAAPRKAFRPAVRQVPRAGQAIPRLYSTDAASPAPAEQQQESKPETPATPATPATEAAQPAAQTQEPKKTDSKPAPRYATNKSKSKQPPPKQNQPKQPDPPKKQAAPVPEDQPREVSAGIWTAAVRSVADGNTDIDWASSYHGIATKPVSPEQYKILIRSIPDKDIEVKPDGVLYLPEIKYRRRLNEAFGPMGWGLIPRGEVNVGAHIVTREYALIVGGRFVSQAQGENTYFNDDQLPSAVEGCKSNALMRCCKDLGIASELWDPEFIRKFRKHQMTEVWVEHITTKKKRAMWFKTGLVHVSYPWRQT